MEQITISKNNLVMLLTTILSLFYAFIWVPENGYSTFPYFTIGLFIISAGLTIAVTKTFENKDKFFMAVLTSALIIGFYEFYRANILLTIINILSAIYLLSIAIIYQKNLKSTLPEILLSPITLLLAILLKRSKYKVRLSKFTIPSGKVKFGGSIPGIIITFAILVIVIPLLSYSNPIFGNLVDNINNSITALLKSIINLDIAFIFRLMVFLLFFGVIPRIITINEDGSKYTKMKSLKNIWSNTSLNIPKIALIIILSIFFITQIQLYFSTPETLETLGYSNSEYAREVFGQLTIVAFIGLSLIYFNSKDSKLSKSLDYVLALMGIFLTLMALKSVNDYVTNWGFTHKRLHGYIGVIWSIGAFILSIYKTRYRQQKTMFLSNLILLTTSAILTINILNFDYIIYHYNQTRTHEGTDYLYFMDLSTDSRSYKEQIEFQHKLFVNEAPNSPVDSRYISHILGRKIENLDLKYNKDRGLDHMQTRSSFREYNFSEFNEYKAISTEYEELETKIEEIYARQAYYNTGYTGYMDIYKNLFDNPNILPPDYVYDPIQIQIKNLPEELLDKEIAISSQFSSYETRGVYNENSASINDRIYPNALYGNKFDHLLGSGSFTIYIFEFDKGRYFKKFYTITENDLDAGNKSLDLFSY